MINEKDVPKKIRQMRLDRHMTQQDLADAAGLTKGYISRLENAESAPPVGTLIALAQAMDVQFNDFFQGEPEEAIVTITRKDERPAVSRDPQGPCLFEHLAMGFPKRAFESYYVEVSPQNETHLLNKHKGQEFVFVLRGIMEFTVDKKKFTLYPGDAMHFNCSYPHSGRCISEEKSEVLCIIWDGKHTA